MEEIRKTQRLLLRRVAVATGAGLLAVVAGLGMAPAGADDDVKVKAEAGVESQGFGDLTVHEVATDPAVVEDVDTNGAELSAEAEAVAEAQMVFDAFLLMQPGVT